MLIVIYAKSDERMIVGDGQFKKGEKKGNFL
jgi:hypothetical protein